MSEQTRGYKDLIVWQKAMDLVPLHHEKAPEGQARQHPAECAQSLAIARGSRAQLDSLLLIALKLRDVADEEIASASPRVVEIRCILHRLIPRIRADMEAS